MQENGQSQANAPVYQQNGKSVSYSCTWESSPALGKNHCPASSVLHGFDYLPEGLWELVTLVSQLVMATLSQQPLTSGGHHFIQDWCYRHPKI